MLIPFKQREINKNKPIKVYRRLYRNSTRVEYSILQDNVVVAHGVDFTLTDVQSKIIKSGQIQARKQKKRNVHAFLVGYLSENKNTKNKNKISYNPFKDDFFTINGNKFISAEEVHFSLDGVYSTSFFICDVES